MIEPWSPSVGRVLIVQRPDGEAPEWVRDAWIGLELPIIAAEPVNLPAIGVLSAPTTWIGFWLAKLTGRFKLASGYLTDANAAVRVLDRHNPAAATWWRTQAPHMLQPGSQFIFDLPACERVE